MERNLSTVPAGTRKRRGEGHTRRDEILIAAKELFLREGYEATTIRRIADVVGVSAPALYLYFKDKDAIMLALCDQTFASPDRGDGGHGAAAVVAARSLAPLRRGLHPLRPRAPARVLADLHVRQHAGRRSRSAGIRPETFDPDAPGSKGAVAFAQLMGIFRDIENSGFHVNYPVETAAELVWMSLHGLVAALINNPEFPGRSATC